MLPFTDSPKDADGTSLDKTNGLSNITQTFIFLLNYTQKYILNQNMYNDTNSTTYLDYGQAADYQSATVSYTYASPTQAHKKGPTESVYHTLTTESEGPKILPFLDYWKVIALSCAFFLCVALVLLVYFFVHRRLSSPPSPEIPEPEPATPYDYVYKPSQQGYIQEEYENTFVGVSIPLLQEVTKV